MIKKVLVLCVALALLLTACAPQSVSQNAADSSTGGRDYAVPEVAPSAPEESKSGGGAIPDVTGSGDKIERIVIKNADLSVVVPDVAAAVDFVAQMAEGMGGFVVSQNLYRTQGESGLETPTARMTVRVPAEKLNDALEQIKGLAENPEEDVQNENITGQDVTKDYTDLQSRLKNLEETEQQLQNILDRTTKTDEVLQVYNQLTYIREQIEVLKGQIKYYDEAAALSAINISLIAKESIEPLTIGGWKPVGVARDALQALITALKGIANAAIYIVIFCLPIGLVLGVPGYFIIRGLLRWNRRRKSKVTVVPTPPAEQ